MDCLENIYTLSAVSPAHMYTLLTFVSGLNNNVVVKNQSSGNSPSTKPMLVAEWIWQPANTSS